MKNLETPGKSGRVGRYEILKHIPRVQVKHHTLQLSLPRMMIVCWISVRLKTGGCCLAELDDTSTKPFFRCYREVPFVSEFEIFFQARARQLFKAGYKSLSSLAWADLNELVSRIEHLSRRQANQIVSAAKVTKFHCQYPVSFK